MTHLEELLDISKEMEQISSSAELASAEDAMRSVVDVAEEVGRSSSGSWLGYHANVYYRDLAVPPADAHFSQEWGLMDCWGTSHGSRGEWCKFDPKELYLRLMKMAGNPNLSAVQDASDAANEGFDIAKREVKSILLTEISIQEDSFLSQMVAELDELEKLGSTNVAARWSPTGEIFCRDMVAIGQPNRAPPHIVVKAEMFAIRHAFYICERAGQISLQAASHLERKARLKVSERRSGAKVFIGHGRSAAWREMRNL